MPAFPLDWNRTLPYSHKGAFRETPTPRGPGSPRRPGGGAGGRASLPGVRGQRHRSSRGSHAGSAEGERRNLNRQAMGPGTARAAAAAAADTARDGHGRFAVLQQPTDRREVRVKLADGRESRAAARGGRSGDGSERQECGACGRGRDRRVWRRQRSLGPGCGNGQGPVSRLARANRGTKAALHKDRVMRRRRGGATAARSGREGRSGLTGAGAEGSAKPPADPARTRGCV